VTPELDQLQARLSALMTYRVAADVLAHLLPIDAGRIAETLRSHTPRVGEQLSDAASDQPAAAVAAITVSLDSTLIRSREEGKRHLEVRVGNVETAGGGRQVFGAVAKTDTDVTTLIRRNLETVGRTADTEVIFYRRLSPVCGVSWRLPELRSHRFSIGSTSRCGCSRHPVQHSKARIL